MNVLTGSPNKLRVAGQTPSIQRNFSVSPNDDYELTYTQTENNSVTLLVEQSSNGTTGWSTLMNITSANGTQTKYFTPTQGFVRVKYSGTAAFSLASMTLVGIDTDTSYSVMARGGYRYGFNGMERDDELKGRGNSYDFGARMYDPRIGRWLTIDPLMSSFPWQSPYVGFDNNPILLIDPDGRGTETTIVGKNGKVMDVIEDGKTDIVQFSDIDESTWDGNGEDLLKTGKGKVVGQTIFWHDFMNTNDKANNKFTFPAYGEEVLNNTLKIESKLGVTYNNGEELYKACTDMYKDMIKDYDQVISMGILALNSANGKQLDIKASLGYSRYTGIYVAEQEGQKIYTSLRVLGNMIFGANMEIARLQQPNAQTKMEFWTTYMVYIGLYNMQRNDLKLEYSFPYYGEHYLSGRAIWLGYWGNKYPKTK
jgi:RHS repeat-associated protein